MRKLTSKQTLKTTLSVLAMALALAGCRGEKEVTIGLITKQEANPYWVTMREVAEVQAKESNVKLLTATGTSDLDFDAQLVALQAMLDEGAQGILIAPTLGAELVPAIEAARAKGVIVGAVDTPFDPPDVADAWFATDNESAGILVGQYALVKSQQLGLTPKIAMLDLAPGIRTGSERHDGFLAGFGIAGDDPVVVAQADAEGNRELGKVHMAEILKAHPDVNVIYTVNEPVALGALDALKEARANLRKIVLVSIDGGCAAIKTAVRRGEIDATAMQFPQNMARQGVKVLALNIREGTRPEGDFDTGVRLITDDAAPGVPSDDVAYGVRNCWGK